MSNNNNFKETTELKNIKIMFESIQSGVKPKKLNDLQAQQSIEATQMSFDLALDQINKSGIAKITFKEGEYPRKIDSIEPKSCSAEFVNSLRVVDNNLHLIEKEQNNPQKDKAISQDRLDLAASKIAHNITNMTKELDPGAHNKSQEKKPQLNLIKAVVKLIQDFGNWVSKNCSIKTQKSVASNLKETANASKRSSTKEKHQSTDKGVDIWKAIDESAEKIAKNAEKQQGNGKETPSNIKGGKFEGSKKKSPGLVR